MNPHLVDVNIKNSESFKSLVRAILLSQGQFSLILVHCNYRLLRQKLLQQLLAEGRLQLQERWLESSALH
ncbi:MAG: hypothetical protein WA919_25505 [Coleofasciculaceae cyanobacterium]